MRRATALVGVVLALSLSACGSKSSGTNAVATTIAKSAAPSSTGTSASTAAMTATTKAAPSGPKAATLAEAKTQMQTDSGLTSTQASCIVDKLVSAVGESKALDLVNVETDLSEMSAEDQKTAGGAVIGCVSNDDFAKLIADGLLSEMKDLGVTQEQANCVGTKMITVITPEALLGLGSGSFDLEKMDPADQGKLFQIFVDCLPPDLLGKLAQSAAAADAGFGGTTTSTAKG